MRTVAVVLAGGFVTCFVVFAIFFVSLRTGVELKNAQATLVTEVNGLYGKAYQEINHGWRDVAKDYVTEYEMGRLDEQFVDAVDDPRKSSNWFAAVAASRVRQAVWRQLEQEGVNPRTEEQVDARLNSDQRIRQLYALSDSSHALFMCKRDIETARSEEELKKVRAVVEEKNIALSQLLKQKP